MKPEERAAELERARQARDKSVTDAIAKRDAAAQQRFKSRQETPAELRKKSYTVETAAGKLRRKLGGG